MTDTSGLTIGQLEKMLKTDFKPGGIISVPEDWMKYPEFMKMLQNCITIANQLHATMQREAKLMEILEMALEGNEDAPWFDKACEALSSEYPAESE